MKISNIMKLLFIAASFCFLFLLCSEIQCIEIYKVLDEKTENFRAMQQRPEGPEEWKDQFGNRAPIPVREAADKLWEKVELEGQAAFDAGYGFEKDIPCPDRFCISLLCCCTLECEIFLDRTCGWCAKNKEFKCVTRMDVDGSKTVAFEQRTEDVKKAIDDFNNVLNQSVVNPEPYHGDIRICKLEKWIEDGRWETQDCVTLIASGRRDMSCVTQSTRDFVNSHGGWVSSSQTYNDPSILKDM